MEVKAFLKLLGFDSKNGILYQKEYKLQGYTIKADIAKGKIYYRTDDKATVERQADDQIQVGDKTTSNFSLPENFVVLECVDRLLNKGYEPNDIHLERRYPSGTGASGGKSDVCVYGKDGKSFLVIECKTWGEEFEKQRKKMNEHGGQVFAYLANDQNAKFLVLYTSRLNTEKTNDDKFDYENLIIHIKDREEDLTKTIRQIEEENLKLYRDAKNKAEYFEVWKESFNKYTHFNGIFDEDAIAYSLDLKALKKKNLKSLDDSQGLFNKFAEILRHNNISDNANAFNKILSLFLCKIVDEEKNEEDILDFQVKEDEQYEHIIDRLQALYQKGMKKLNEETVYFADDVITNIIALFPRQTPLEELQDVFTQLKYYTNNEFAFKEVHNKKLFDQNGRVLAEVIKLLQNYRFRFTRKQSVLGDFFELMLNHGVKQSEGQFFTPIPIVRFMILSLGFEQIIRTKIEQDDDYLLPKILDYACGAGHFLTESVEELQYLIKKIDTSKLSTENQRKIEQYKDSTIWAKEAIFGIEKDFRLARTSQIACYINGDGDANIIFGDGLEEHEQLWHTGRGRKFDVIIANPPYSVKAFKNYLNVNRSNYTLFQHLTETSSEIEVLFIERTMQLMAYRGVAGLIMPSSILSNTGIYAKAREILLKYFEIKAITELGSKTFIATGTTTVILFLKRRNDNFLRDRHYIADDLFNKIPRPKELTYINAYRLLEMFTQHRGFNYKEYEDYLTKNDHAEIHKTPIFMDYKQAFDNSTEIKNLKEKKFFKEYDPSVQAAELEKKFGFYTKNIEKEKFLYFMLCLGDGYQRKETLENYYTYQQTVVVKSGKEVDEQKAFLGYYIDKAKGQEGIKVTTPGGKMYDDTHYMNPDKAATYIRQAFNNEPICDITVEQQKHTNAYRLVDLMEFDRVDFEKIIKTSTESKLSWQIVWKTDNLVNISEIAELKKGTSITLNDVTEGNIPVVAGGQTPAYFHNTANRGGNTITISASGAYAGFVNYWTEPIFASDCTTLKSLDEQKITTKLIYEYLKIIQQHIYKLQRGQAQPHVYSNDISNIKIPLASWDAQNAIIQAINTIEQQENAEKAQLADLRAAIIAESDNLYTTYPKKKLGTLCDTPQYGAAEKAIAGDRLTDFRYIRITDIDEHGNLTNDFMTAENIEDKFRLQQGDFLFARSGNTVGKTFYYDNQVEKAIYAGYLIRFRPKKDQFIPKFLDIVTKSSIYKTWIKANMAGTAQPNINAQQYANFEIPVPTIAQQEATIALIAQKEKDIQRLQQSLSTMPMAKESVLRQYL